MVETSTQNKVRKLGRKQSEGLCKIMSQGKLGERRGEDEMVIKSFPTCKMQKRGREIFQWLVEVFTKCEVCESGRKGVNLLVEIRGKSEVGERRRQEVYWLIKTIIKFELSE
jgi:hypothetical protein